MTNDKDDKIDLINDYDALMSNFECSLGMMVSSLANAEAILGSLLFTMSARDHVSKSIIKKLDKLTMQVHNTRKELDDEICNMMDEERIRFLVERGVLTENDAKGEEYKIMEDE